MAKKQDMSKTYIIIAIIIGVAILGYGFMNYSAKMKVLEADKQAKQDKILEESSKELKLKMCNIDANDDYVSDWNSQCKAFGKKDNCTLPQYSADNVEGRKEKALDNCIKLYGK